MKRASGEVAKGIDGKALSKVEQEQHKESTRVIRYDPRKNPILIEQTIHKSIESRSSMNSFHRLSIGLGLSNDIVVQEKTNKYEVEWKKDDEYTTCQVCHLSFTSFSRRRHHCRVCGDLICHECSLNHIYMYKRFTRPKRACSPCFTLFEAIMYHNDPRMTMYIQQTPDSKKWTNITKHLVQPIRNGSILEHDYVIEIQRVTAAARRKNDQENKFCIINAPWLRSWLEYTKTMTMNSEMDRAHQVKVFPPGPIQQFHLLEIKQGRLQPLKGLVPCPGSMINVEGWNKQVEGDYQVIPLRVWEAFHRYYGGGPRILVQKNGEWDIDIAKIIEETSSLRQVQENIEKRDISALVKRHQTKASDRTQVSRESSYEPRSKIMSTRFSSMGPPQMGRSVSTGEVDHRQRQRHIHGEVNRAKSVRSSYNERPPKAAQAASAFAEAMKQARLNAQKSISLDSSRLSPVGP